MEIIEYCSEDLGHPESFKKSASASNLLEIDSCLEKHNVLSKSLDFLDTLPLTDIKKCQSSEHIIETSDDKEVKRPKSSSLSVPKHSYPFTQLKSIKSLYVGEHFGTKRFNIGRKIGSVISWNPKR